MTATSGVFLPATSIHAAQPTNSSSSSSSSSSSTAITASDFLTLLVTELQNQDPTADTDPNEYINQLVGINSLEQLVSINQNLQTALGVSSSSASLQSASGAEAVPNVQTLNNPQAATASSQMAPLSSSIISGNLSTPSSTHAADRIATALSGQR